MTLAAFDSALETSVSPLARSFRAPLVQGLEVALLGWLVVAPLAGLADSVSPSDGTTQDGLLDQKSRLENRAARPPGWVERGLEEERIRTDAALSTSERSFRAASIRLWSVPVFVFGAVLWAVWARRARRLAANVRGQPGRHDEVSAALTRG
jgi:hypothetical protein